MKACTLALLLVAATAASGCNRLLGIEEPTDQDAATATGGGPAVGSGGAGGLGGLGGTAGGGAGGRGSGGAAGRGGSGGGAAGAQGICLGTACPCTPLTGRLDIDIPSVTIGGAFTVNGTAVPIDVGGFARLVLRTAAGDEARLGDNRVASFSTPVLPGTYDLYYDGGYGLAAPLPANSRMKLRSGVALTAAATMNIDVSSVAVAGTFTINGARPSSSVNESVSFTLVGAGGDVISLGATNGGATYAVRVVPGTYDLVCRGSQNAAATVAPRNTSATLKAGISFTQDTTLDIDVPVVTVHGAITVNGAAPPSTDPASLYLGTGATDLVSLGTTTAGSYTSRIIPGTYEVFIETTTATTSSGATPKNKRAKVLSDVVIAGDTTLNIDVPSVMVSGAIKINGAPPPSSSSSDFGTLRLKNAAGDEVNLGDTRNSSYAKAVLPGTYDLYFQTTTGAVMYGVQPFNQNARLQSGVVIAAATTLDVDLVPVTVSGTILGRGNVTGALPYSSLVLRNAAGDAVALGQSAATAAGSYMIRALPGTFDLYLERTTSTGFPRNLAAKVGSGVVIAADSTTMNFDVVSVAFAGGAFRINGDTPPVQAADDYGTVSLHGALAADAIPLGTTYSGSYALVGVVPGSYDVVYKGFLGTGIHCPRNQNAKLGCFIVGP